MGRPCSLAQPADAVLPRHEAKKLDPSGQYALVAGREAWQDAGAPDVDAERMGVVVATGIGGVWTLLDAYDTLKDRGHRRVPPMTVPIAATRSEMQISTAPRMRPAQNFAPTTRPRCGSRVKVVSPVRWLHSLVTMRISRIGRK